MRNAHGTVFWGTTLGMLGGIAMALAALGRGWENVGLCRGRE